MVHNLRRMVWEDTAFGWAQEFDAKLKSFILDGDHQALVSYEKQGEVAHLAIPTNEHFLPLLYVLPLQENADNISFFCEKITLGSISMRSFMIGQ